MSQNIYGTSGSNVAQQQYQRYAQQQQVRPAPTLDPQVTINHYTFSANAMAANAAALNQQQQQQQTAARPLSASATAHTTKASSHDRWYANNRTNYGYSAAQAAAMNNSGSVHSTGATNRVTPTAVAPQVGSYKPTASAEKTLSRPSSKLRDAVDLSHKIEAQGGDASAAQKQQDLEAGIDNDDGDGDGEDYDEAEANGDEVMGLDAQRPQTAGGTQMGLNHHFRKHRSGGNAAAAGAAAVGASAGGGAVGAAGAEEEQEEMDGKPVDQSRSHPEVSMTTPSASLELAHASSSLHQNAHNSNGVDARNSSFDSLTEDNLQIGLSTVPNQFCTKRDALDLRKLISLSAGTRGGIVPSSSAVMDMYMVGKVVGVGSYGKVRAAWHRLTSAKVAIKTYDKSKVANALTLH